jgi:hypothetical protein
MNGSSMENISIQVLTRFIKKVAGSLQYVQEKSEKNSLRGLFFSLLY